MDDHALYRESLGNMLRPHGIKLSARPRTAKKLKAAITTLQPDLILMDIHMLEQDGLETANAVWKQQYPHIKIVMLTMAEDESYSCKPLKYGASGLLA
ncbi:MAG: response regulator transcription factor [Chloroflexi bacterium]|nr:response regulator transcription factor [Chloroflexota bacterium]